MGLLYGTHMGPIWATRTWANPYGSHVEPGCTPHMGPLWVAHMPHIAMFAGKLLLLLLLLLLFKISIFALSDIMFKIERARKIERNVGILQ